MTVTQELQMEVRKCELIRIVTEPMVIYVQKVNIVVRGDHRCVQTLPVLPQKYVTELITIVMIVSMNE